MNNVHVPAQVVTILRRLANVVSTLSISNHYFLCKSDNNPRYQDRIEWLRWENWDLNCSLLSAKELNFQWLYAKWTWRSVQSSSGTEFSTNSSVPAPRQDGKEPARDRWPPSHSRENLDVIHQLLQNPALCDPLRTPRYPIVLCHGLYGFDTRGPSSFPSMRMHYWANVLSILRGKLGAETIVTSVPGTGSVYSRSESLDRQLQIRAHGRGLNFLAHSMGGLDCRYLISHIKPTDYVPLSLTTISTPHRGSPFMDWCAENLGLGKAIKKEGSSNALVFGGKHPPSKDYKSPSLSFSSLPSSFTTLLLSVLDSPAYANLTSNFLNDVFNPATPDDPSVKYFSIAGRMSNVTLWHPLWLPKMVLDSFEEEERNKLKAAWENSHGNKGGSDPNANPLWAQDREWGNDGLVTIQSAKWGDFLGIMEECDHWQMRGARGIEFGVDLPNITALSPDWSFRDWSRFSHFWVKETKEENARTRFTGPESSKTQQRYLPAGSNAVEERERKLAQDDAIVKSSTDKLSAVVDWLIEQVPSTSKLKSSAAGEVNIGSLSNDIGKLRERVEKSEKPKPKNSELETKEDLERFYIALCRKIYDEGL